MESTSDDDTSIAIVDYGMGNLQSIRNAFTVVGATPRIIRDPADLYDSDAIVLPGVGAFPDGMRNLREAGFVEPLEELVRERRLPYLGVCLGMQFLATEGTEHSRASGLGWIPGVVERISPSEPGYTVPHMGWNDVVVRRDDSVLLSELGPKPTFYFVHSFHLVPTDNAEDTVTSTAFHGTSITASVRQDNVFGVQFHPEKSQGGGLKLLENFMSYVNGGTGPS